MRSCFLSLQIYVAYRCVLSRNTLHQNLLFSPFPPIRKWFKRKVERLFVSDFYGISGLFRDRPSFIFCDISRKIGRRFLTALLNSSMCPF